MKVCYYCQGEATEKHHRIPRCQKGADTPRNVRDVCRPCHVAVHEGDWAVWGRLGGIVSARMRRMKAGSVYAFRRQMRELALRRVA